MKRIEAEKGHFIAHMKCRNCGRKDTLQFPKGTDLQIELPQIDCYYCGVKFMKRDAPYSGI